ncbi:ABC transporter permease [Flavobacteriaceae bacterium F89]|uniref:ABC transporter permease n=1 Tax=Cerina litoralis TaxID=2874477 RepID=A0AAE3EUX7_9FLAO|nr:ABC transporter permease [Cerina litoralis]MCG2460196.1 ABC transporter permease [Cerina litoralis]
MHKLLASAYKEFLLLIRDMGGISILFVMPLILVVTITLIQDSTFKSIKDVKIPILWVDNDRGTVSENIYANLTKSNTFNVIHKDTEEEARDLVFKGKYQLAVIIPANLSSDLGKKIDDNVTGILSQFGLEKGSTSDSAKIAQKEIRLYFDPATQFAFRSSVKNGIDKMISQIESRTIYRVFQEQLSGDGTKITFNAEGLISFKEIVPTRGDKEILPNSTQHNVPAWTLFAIFFIIVPLSINMVKEKNQGTFVRLRTNPVSYATVLGGKTLIYLCVCLIQFSLMLLVGLYLLPTLGLPQLDLSGRLPLLFLVALFAGLAAIGLGLLLGTIAKTQEQSAPFGATFVVILAAMGGVWVPVFLMPRYMQYLSNLSPMNWGLKAFYDVFLRNAGFGAILPELLLLLLFFVITTGISIIYNERQHAV